MRPKKLSTILENMIEEIDSIYSDYIQTKQELDLKIRVWATTYVNDLEHHVFDTCVNFGEYWRYKGLSYPIHLQEIDINAAITEAENLQQRASDYKQHLYTQLVQINTEIKLLTDRSEHIASEQNTLCQSKHVKHISDWDNLHRAFVNLPSRIKQSRFLTMPFVSGFMKTAMELYAKSLRMPINTKEYSTWHNQLIKMRNMDIPSIDGKTPTASNILQLIIENAILSDKYTRLSIEQNELDHKLETLKHKAQLLELEYQDALLNIDTIQEEHKSALSRRSRLALIKENNELYQEAKSRAITVITSYIVQDYTRSLTWLSNDGAAELVSEIETLTMLSNKFELLNAARFKLEKEIEEGENVTSIQSALKEKDLLSTAMYLTGNSLSLPAHAMVG